MNVLLPDDLADLVRTKIDTGRYGSPGDVVREALRLMERVEQQNAEKLRQLRALWQQGIESGDDAELDIEALKAEGRARLASAKA